MQIGTILKHARKEKGYTQQDLADLLYISSKTISRWETDNGLPELSMLVRLSEILDLNFDQLIESLKNESEVYQDYMDLSIKNAIIISATISFLGLLIFLYGSYFVSKSVFLVTTFISLFLLIISMITYLILENIRMNKIGRFKKNTLKKYRLKAMKTWYIISSFGSIGVLYYFVKDLSTPAEGILVTVVTYMIFYAVLTVICRIILKKL